MTPALCIGDGMKTIKLSKRLQAIADYVPLGALPADIGTDHGYIPVWLVQRGIARRVIASDIGKGPLESARRSAAEYGAAEQIDFVLADGLAGVRPGDADTVIIAGMGGETICGILQAADWVKDSVQLILQPQSKYELLCTWLGQNGFRIDAGRLVQDEGRIYQIMCVRADGVPKELDWQRDYIRGLLAAENDPLLPAFLDGLIGKYRHMAAGMAKAADAAQDPEFTRIKRELDDWISLKGEIL